MLCLFNAEDTPLRLSANLVAKMRVRDVWTGEALGTLDRVTLTLPPHSARLLECARG
jgi:hypothetical protein